MKSRRHRATRVAGGRHQDRELAVIWCAHARKAGGEKARPEVLESRGGTMKELEHGKPPVSIERHERCGKVECLACDRRQLRRERILCQKGREQECSDRSELARAVEVGDAQ